MSMSMARTRSKPDYGPDSPYLARHYLAGGLGALLLSFIIIRFFPTSWQQAAVLAGFIALILVFTGIWLFFSAAIISWRGNFHGKAKLRDQLIQSFTWHGKEQILEVSQGQGLLLLAAAKQAPRGRAVGVNVCQRPDQAQKRIQATLENARIEDVAERLEMHAGEAYPLSFSDGQFDVVLSAWTLNRYHKAEDRKRILAELARVLKPGGRIAILDVHHPNEYINYFKDNGFKAVQISPASYIYVTPSYQVDAVKARANEKPS
jgi:arsenite methyltransferase